MFMRKLLNSSVLTICLTCFLAHGEESALKISGNVQMQGQRMFYDNGSNNNLDQLWLRCNLGASYILSNFTSFVNIRAFSEGFGYDPLTQVDFGKQKTKSKSVALFVLEQAFVSAKWKYIGARAGYICTEDTRGINYGGYLDTDPSGGFKSRSAHHSMIELNNSVSFLNSSVMVRIKDQFLNTADLRVYERLSFLEGRLGCNIGYIGNIFDPINNDNAQIKSRVDISLEYTILKDMMAFIECGALDIAKGEKSQIPLLAGVTIPTKNVFDQVLFEMEYLNDRVVAGKEKPIMVDLFLLKKFSKRFKMEFEFILIPVGLKYSTLAQGCVLQGP